MGANLKSLPFVAELCRARLFCHRWPSRRPSGLEARLHLLGGSEAIELVERGDWRRHLVQSCNIVRDVAQEQGKRGDRMILSLVLSRSS